MPREADFFNVLSETFHLTARIDEKNRHSLYYLPLFMLTQCRLYIYTLFSADKANALKLITPHLSYS